MRAQLPKPPPKKTPRAPAKQPGARPDATATGRLLAWFDATRRDLPWRGPPGAPRDVYRVWLSEIMLQQTQVATVAPYFETFVARWPDVGALARAADDDVLACWAGLGYYARARNLIACARQVAFERGGRFPETEAGLLALPGVGPYTAAAIAAIAFGLPSAPVDGNIARVLARRLALDAPLPALKAVVQAELEKLLPPLRPGDFAEALMDLGATLCKPKAPDCRRCPWAGDCLAEASGTPAAWPRRDPARARPTRRGWVFWLERPRPTGSEVLLVKRPPSGLLGGMTALPTGVWHADTALDAPEGLSEARRAVPEAVPEAVRWRVLSGRVSHSFTHFNLELGVVLGHLDVGLNRATPATAGPESAAGFRWCPTDGLGDMALPRLMTKVAELVMAEKTREQRQKKRSK